MHPADIQAALKKKGLNHQKVADILDPPVDRSLVTKVILGDSSNRAVRETIARIVGLPIRRLWPEGRKVA